MSIRRSFCRHCQSEGPATVLPMPHFIHLFLTIVTCGWWSIVWVICYKLKVGEKANCNRCGSPV